MTSAKIRQLKNTLARSGYRDFSLKTHAIKFSNQEATLISTETHRASVTNETTLIIFSYKDDYYILLYQWLSNWNKNLKVQFQEIINSFRFTI